MRKEHNFYSFWHRELVPADFSWKERNNKKRKNTLFVPEKNRTSGRKKAENFSAERIENSGKVSAVEKRIAKVYSPSGRNPAESPLKISTLSAKIRRIIHAEYEPFSQIGREKIERTEEKIYSLIRRYMKENLPEESI